MKQQRLIANEPFATSVTKGWTIVPKNEAATHEPWNPYGLVFFKTKRAAEEHLLGYPSINMDDYSIRKAVLTVLNPKARSAHGKKTKKAAKGPREKKPPLNWLQGHYNACMKAGGSHIEYEIVNDLSAETAKELKETYERFYAGKGRKRS